MVDYISLVDLLGFSFDLAKNSSRNYLGLIYNFMKFNEWLTQNNKDFDELSPDIGMETIEDVDLIESQVEQWITKLVGLLDNASEETRQRLVGKIVSEIQKRI